VDNRGTTRARAAARRTGSEEEDAFVELLRTGDHLTRATVGVLKPADLSPAQYNVLRILRGAGQALPCGDLAARMITRDPDITRLLDRLETRGLIARAREGNDRRVVLTRITPPGLKLLAGLDEPIQAAHRRQLGHLGPARLRRLRQLLRAARGAPA
jgi:DNA-binding MarR family transcriptional regulator